MTRRCRLGEETGPLTAGTGLALTTVRSPMNPSLSDLLTVARPRRPGRLHRVPGRAGGGSRRPRRHGQAGQGTGHRGRLRVAGGDPGGRRRRLSRTRGDRRGGSGAFRRARRGGRVRADRAPRGPGPGPLREPGRGARLDRPPRRHRVRSPGSSTPSTAPRASCAATSSRWPSACCTRVCPWPGCWAAPTCPATSTDPASPRGLLFYGGTGAGGVPGGPRRRGALSRSRSARCRRPRRCGSWAAWSRPTATRRCCRRSSTGPAWEAAGCASTAR